MQCLQYYQRFAMSKPYDISFSGFAISGCYFLEKVFFMVIMYQTRPCVP